MPPRSVVLLAARVVLLTPVFVMLAVAADVVAVEDRQVYFSSNTHGSAPVSG
jgi:hypothetical protein